MDTTSNHCDEKGKMKGNTNPRASIFATRAHTACLVYSGTAPFSTAYFDLRNCRASYDGHRTQRTIGVNGGLPNEGG